MIVTHRLAIQLALLALLASGACDEAGSSGATDATSTADADTASGLDTEAPQGPCEGLAEAPQQVLLDGASFFPPTTFTAEQATIARWVGDDLYVEIQWPGDDVRLRAGLVLRSARGAKAVELSSSDVEVFGIERFQGSPFSWARLYDTDPPAVGCVGVSSAGAKVSLHLDLHATLTALGPGPSEPVQIDVIDHLTLTPEVRAAYDGSCTGSGPALAAVYLPLQVSDYQAGFRDWEGVEGDCQRAPGSGCRTTSAGACGDGDRWLCRTCFDDTCVAAAFQSECLPPR